MYYTNLLDKLLTTFNLYEDKVDVRLYIAYLLFIKTSKQFLKHFY